MDEIACAGACIGGNLEILKWLCENGCEINESCYKFAVREGHLHILKYLHENDFLSTKYFNLCAIAVHYNQLETLKYLHEIMQNDLNIVHGYYYICANGGYMCSNDIMELAKTCGNNDEIINYLLQYIFIY